METISQIFGNKIFMVSLFSCFFAQFLKIFTGDEKLIQPSRILTSGGMPSSHSSFVSTLSVLVGMEAGFDSMEFAVVLVFSLIIMYDASGVRRAVGKQATILNQIVEDLQHKKQVEHKKLKELVGHTPKEVLFGALLGTIIALLLA
ncbi:MAG: divergent PAP2 family protein [Peptostreptococcaceae bacterium]